MKQLIIFTDGASSGNPGPGWAMFVIGNLKKRVKLEYCTNNEAEYKAVIYALTELISQPALYQNCEQVQIKIDSNLVVQQLNGFFKIKHPKMREYAAEVNRLLLDIPIPVQFQYIPREENLADELKY